MNRIWKMPEDYPAFAASLRRSRSLRQLWNSTIEEEVPDDIKRLLDKLD